ncbi:Nramp family divalent metal transporter [Thermovenabulum gondwanense]|uniref:Divalent metal cation transporter MntH n=1 Tax=Thermovenabulum gondwanense TaxID=520767 RepID=A0A162MHW9_9FIRM|nr:Nramp family divalent metal transporter [Thermovenabulum gondwanense]KYO66106.1 Divalent metal cation transporter MntH [Thermovenabulum gondwanense]
MNQKNGGFFKRMLLLFSIIGPGLITGIADDDATGIATYASVGASYGYRMLWGLFLITISLIIVQEMAARMGAVTGKGLSALIRENFGVKMTLFAMLTLLITNLAITVADFAGAAASLEILNVPKYISVPLIALLVWMVILRGSYRKAERFFLILSLVMVSYIITAFLVKPDWGEVIRSTFVPSFSFDRDFVMMFIAMVGTTITPWMQFYHQASVVDKGIDVKHYEYEKMDVVIGSLVSNVLAFFIIVTTAATLNKAGITIDMAEDAAAALRPLAGNYASTLFAIGLFGASLIAAHIVPLSTAYAITEAFGFENGLDKTFKEAPVFYGIILFFIILGSLVIFLPSSVFIQLIIISQVVTGILTPIILIYMIVLTNKKEVMGEYVNGRIFNAVAWVTVGFIILLTVILTLSPLIG